MKEELSSLPPSSFRLPPSLYRVARERVREDDDSGQNVRHLHLVRPRQNLFGLEAVERLVQIVVGVDDRPFEFESGEETFAARVGENPRVQLEVGRGCCRPTDGPGCGARLAADLQLVAEQTLQGVVVHKQQNEVGLRRADLQAYAC